jgi:methionyl-tRNA formyltransferase
MAGPTGVALAVLRASASSGDCGATVAPGTLLDRKRFLVQTAEGALELLSVQPPGKPEMDGEAFLRGARLAPPARLG